MKKSRFTEVQIIKALQAQESGQKTIKVLCRELGISVSTFHKWKQKYGGLQVNEAKRLREMEQENNRLKRMVANLMLENEAIQETLKKL